MLFSSLTFSSFVIARPHKGVDLAAPIGTAIRAAGDGRIEKIAFTPGYGNMIKIAHNKNYQTVYAHMLRFQKGIAKGDHVKRGQIIGYVGQSGLASGPHLHYEFHHNSIPKNPTTIDLPLGVPIPKSSFADFKMHANMLVAQIKLYEEASIAENSQAYRTFG